MTVAGNLLSATRKPTAALKKQGERHWVPAALLFVMATVVFSPLLLHPHWGFFSDAGQILEDGRFFFQPHRINLPLLVAQYRPGFNILDKLVWLLSPEKPFGFYAFRWILFAATVVLTYFNSYALSRSRLFSCLFTSVIFFASPTYEVIYTLDKGEVYISFLFASFLNVVLRTMNSLVGADLAPRTMARTKALLTFICAYAMFTKQTGQLLLLASGTCVAGCAAVRWKPQWLSWLSSTDRALLERQFKWAKAALTISLCSYLAFELFMISAGGLGYKYGATNVLPAFWWSQLKVYATVIPDLLGLIAASLIGALLLPVVRKDVVEAAPFRYVYAAAITLSAVAASVALLSWVGELSYIWLPIYTFVLPVATYFLSGIFSARRVLRFGLFTAVVLACMLMIPARSIEGQIQYKMDRLAQTLSFQLSRLAPTNHKQVRLIMPFTKPECAEVGERIESLTMNHLVPRYMESKPDDRLKLRMYNAIEYWAPPELEQTPVLEHYSEELQAVAESGYEPTPGIDIFAYWSDHYVLHSHHWCQNKLKPGDVLLLPHGNIDRHQTLYRGVSLFVDSCADQMRFMPQVHVAPIFDVATGVRSLASSKPLARFGWTAFKITHIDPLSWPISHDGWLMQNAWILCDRSLVGHKLNVDSRLGFPKSIDVHYGSSVKKIDGVEVSPGVLRFAIPVVETGKQSAKLVLTSDDPTRGTGDTRPLMLHVDAFAVQ